jgi:O-antigen/teichoic acid export membrane protein
MKLTATLRRITESQSLRNVFRGSAFIFACRLSGAAVTFLTQVVMARWMGAGELGVFVLAFSWVTVLAVLAVAGLNGAAMRFIGQPLATDDFSAIRGFMRRSRQISLGFSLLIAAVMIILARGGYIGDNQYEYVYLLAAAALPFYTLIVHYAGIANAFSWFSISFMPNNVTRPLGFFAAIAAYWYLAGTLDATLSMLLHMLVIMVIGVAVAIRCERAVRKRIPPAEPTFNTRLWLRTSLPIMFMILFSSYFSAFTVIVAGAILTNEDIAIFNAGFRIALLVSFGVTAIDAYVSPELMRLYAQGEQDALRRLVTRTTRIRFLVALGGVVTFVIAGKWILGFFGPEFVAGYWVLIILGLTQLAQAAAGPAARLLSMTGHQDHGLYISVAALLLSAVLIWAFALQLGVIGAALAALIAIVAWCLGMNYAVATQLGIRSSLFALPGRNKK